MTLSTRGSDTNLFLDERHIFIFTSHEYSFFLDFVVENQRN